MLLPLALIAVTLLVIRPEERYLGERFGPEYAAYRAQRPAVVVRPSNVVRLGSRVIPRGHPIIHREGADDGR